MATIIDTIATLIANQSAPAAHPAKDTCPLRAVYGVPFNKVNYNPDFPKDVAKLLSAISTSSKPYDLAKRKNSITDETLGAMRQIHSNAGPSWLPRLTKTAMSGRAKLYDDYCQQNKAQNTQNGGGNVTTGYVEYTASDEATYTDTPPKRSRIVFDYINGRVFFSPQHYHSWTITGTTITCVSGNETAFTPTMPNAFFQIIDITTLT